MKTLTSLDRVTVCDILEDMMKALKPVADKYGIQFKYRGGTFTVNTCTYKIEAAALDTDGTVVDRDR